MARKWRNPVGVLMASALVGTAALIASFLGVMLVGVRVTHGPEGLDALHALGHWLMAALITAPIMAIGSLALTLRLLNGPDAEEK